jgi:hypothetical protein
VVIATSTLQAVTRLDVQRFCHRRHHRIELLEFLRAVRAMKNARLLE